MYSLELHDGSNRAPVRAAHPEHARQTGRPVSGRMPTAPTAVRSAKRWPKRSKRATTWTRRLRITATIFQVLKGQGPAAPLGEIDYVINGAMIGGFALIATPAEYGVTGIQTFIVNHNGIVYQKDLGPGLGESGEADHALQPGQDLDPDERRLGEVAGGNASTAEEALEASRDLLASIVETVPARVFWKDADLCFLGCNSLFACDAGFAHREDLVGKDDFQMPWREQADKYRADDRMVIESGTPKLGIEEPQSTPDGRTIWLRTSKVPWHGVDGKTIGDPGYLRGHHGATSRRRRPCARARSASAATSRDGLIAMAITLPDKRFSEVNARFCEIFGYPREELLRMDWASLTHPDDLAGDVSQVQSSSER